MSTLTDPVLTARRREQLYGASRVDEIRSLRTSLTQDHISTLNSDRTKIPPWASTTKFAYKGTQPDKMTALSLDSGLQNQAHFEMRGEGASVDNGLYLKSLTGNDYKKHETQRKLAARPENQINLPDMNPRFFRDQTFGSSFYNSDFSKTLQRESTLPDLQKARTEMRRRNVKDIRTTHFDLGNDNPNFQTETISSFNSRPRSVRLEPLPPTLALQRSKTEPLEPASMVRKMLEEERESYVFRRGDYNVTAPKPKLSTFQRDYDAMPKEPKAAAFIEPTQIAKGRFLQDADILKASIKDEMILTPEDETTKATMVSLNNGAILKNILLQYDIMKTGYINKESLQRACNSLLDPIPQPVLDEVLKSTKEGPGKSIDYLDFIRQYNLKAISASISNAKEVKPSVTISAPRSAGGSGGTGPVLVNASSGKDYQTSVHFKFGTDEERSSTIYNKDYDSQILKADEKPTKVHGPKSSEVMHTMQKPGGVEVSTKQSDFVNFLDVDKVQLRSILVTRDKQGLKNKERHDKNSVILTCDKDRDAKDRHHSLSHESYVKFAPSTKVTMAPPLPKYRYLDSNGALPYPANMPGRSETIEAYNGCNLSMPEETEHKLTAFKAENSERVKDSRRVHFKFGNDAAEHSTEAKDNFVECRAVGDEIPAAGTKNQGEPQYPHQKISQNTEDLSGNPMAPGIFDSIRLAKRSYYNTAPNPSDPLHIKLRRVIMETDPQHTGHVTRRKLKEACSQFKINVSANVLDGLIQRCDKHGDDKVDYHQFIRSLTLEQVPESVSSSHTASLMRNDYRPIDQRSFTNAQLLTMQHMQMKPVKPQQSHFFHRDTAEENQFTSVTNQDFIKPEMMAASI
ncbi:uncharacterized protein [Asterias amurensis]|uniref:uncharacterized protein n=1 Tax=Asterias amurensis TaxID=7602 RepID=UPI003AB15F07